MKAAFLTLGCKLNYAETSTYERGFISEGVEVVPWKEKADIYLVNTCSVTAASDAKSRNLIRKVHRVNPDAVLVVTGCSAQLRRGEIEAIEGVSRVFGAAEKEMVVAETLSLAAGGSKPVGLAGVSGIFPAYSSGERTRSFLKVQDGCDNFCRYCTVPYARGRSRSVPLADCVKMAEEIASRGMKEIVLTGVNTGDWGRGSGESFLHLLQALNDVDGIERYRISSIEPNLLTDEIVEWIASGTKFQPHFHIPLQSGCDSILKNMGRHYDTAFFGGRIEKIRSALEGPGKSPVFFGIDLMAGLPGETSGLFEEQISFLESIRPSFIHVFPYSRRPGTPAAEMPGQVEEREKAHRVAELEKLSTAFHDAFICANKGVRERVLFESSCRKGNMEGYTGNYIRVERPYDASLVNTIVDVVL